MRSFQNCKVLPTVGSNPVVVIAVLYRTRKKLTTLNNVPCYNKRVMNVWNALPADVTDFGSVKKFSFLSLKLILAVLPNVLKLLFCFNMFLLCLYYLRGFSLVFYFYL